MSLTKYRAFIKVVELGSLTKAAKQLGYSQPGISHMIDSLEAEMGFPLLIRNKDSIVPTESGKKILYYCHQIIKNEDSLLGNRFIHKWTDYRQHKDRSLKQYACELCP